MAQFPNHPDQLKEFLHKLVSFTSEQIDDLSLSLPESWLKNPKYLDRLHISLIEAYPNLAPKIANLLPDLLPSLGHRLWLGWWPILQGDWGLATTVNWLQKNSEDKALLVQFIDMVLGRKSLDSENKSLDNQLGYLALERMLITQCEKFLPLLRPSIKTPEGIKLFLKFFTNQPDVISNLIYHDILNEALDTINNPPTPDWDIELSLELVTLAIPYLSQKLQSHLVPLLHILTQFSYAPMFTILYEIIPLNLIQIVKDNNHIAKIEQKLGFKEQGEVNKQKKHTRSKSLKVLLLQHNIHPNSLIMEWEEELSQLNDIVSQQDPTTIVTQALLKYNAPPEVLLNQSSKSSPHYESLPFYVYHLIHHLRSKNLDHLPASVREGDHHQVFIQLKSLQQENKSLKEKLERNLIETQNRQSNHVKWENELNSKLRNFREQVKELKTKLQSTETELQSIKQINPENENPCTGLNPEIELTRLNELEDENIKLKDKVYKLVETMVQWQTQYEDKIPITELLSESN